MKRVSHTKQHGLQTSRPCSQVINAGKVFWQLFQISFFASKSFLRTKNYFTCFDSRNRDSHIMNTWVDVHKKASCVTSMGIFHFTAKKSFPFLTADLRGSGMSYFLNALECSRRWKWMWKFPLFISRFCWYFLH